MGDSWVIPSVTSLSERSVSFLSGLISFLIVQNFQNSAHPSSQNKHFFSKSYHRQTYQNYEQPCQRSQNSDFQIDRIFPNFSSSKNT